MPEKCVLLTARDPAAVGYVLAVEKLLRDRSHLTPVIAASSVAYEQLSQQGRNPLPFPTDQGLIEAARMLLHKTDPVMVIACHSSDGFGIDEAVISAAEHLPRLVIQDFWGEVNPALIGKDVTYLVFDKFAANLTYDRWGIQQTCVVGSLKHMAYTHLDAPGVRRETRHRLGISQDTTLIGLFGQSAQLPGYNTTIHQFLSTLRANPGDNQQLLVRHHPKYSGTDLHPDIRAELDTLPLPVVNATNRGRVEDWLVSCDVVVTLFSLIGLDHAYLSAYSSQPLGVSLYLLWDPALQSYLKAKVGLPHLPTVDQGLGQAVASLAELPSMLKQAIQPATARRYHEASKTLLSHQSPEFILREIHSVLGRS